MVAQGVIVGCWTLLMLYWGVSAWFVKPTLRVRWRLGGLRWIIIAAAAVLAFARIRGWPVPFGDVFRPPAGHPIALVVAGVVLVVIGLAVAVVARWTLG